MRILGIIVVVKALEKIFLVWRYFE